MSSRFPHWWMKGRFCHKKAFRLRLILLWHFQKGTSRPWHMNWMLFSLLSAHQLSKFYSRENEDYHRYPRYPQETLETLGATLSTWKLLELWQGYNQIDAGYHSNSVRSYFCRCSFLRLPICTVKSLSEALIFASTNPQFEDKLSMDLQDFMSLEFSYIELVIQWTICRHIVG